MNEPCTYCAVRADVGCRHRAAEGIAPASITEAPPAASTRSYAGNGANFRRRGPK